MVFDGPMGLVVFDHLGRRGLILGREALLDQGGDVGVEHGSPDGELGGGGRAVGWGERAGEEGAGEGGGHRVIVVGRGVGTGRVDPAGGGAGDAERAAGVGVVGEGGGRGVQKSGPSARLASLTQAIHDARGDWGSPLGLGD